MTKKVFALLLALAMVLGMCSAAYAIKPGDENTLVVFFTEDPESLDGQMTTEYYTVPLNAFDRLVECITVDGQPQLVPGLADSWEVSDDALTYTFKLHEGVKFHNGNDFTAEDVVYTIDRMMNPDNLAKNTDFYDMIKGAAARFDGQADSVEGVRVIDDYTVEITLERPFAPFLSSMATPGCIMLDSEATAAAGDQFGIDPAVTVGTGPFVCKTWVLGNEIYLEANQDYFRGAPAIDGIRFLIVPDPDTQRMMFEAGEVDVFDFTYSPSQLPYFRGNDQYKDRLVSGPEAGLYFYLFNFNLEPVNDINVRKALQMAVDRQAMLDSLFNGEGTLVNTIIPHGVLGFNPDAPEIKYDPEAAKALLAEAGYPNGLDLEIVQTAANPSTLAMNEVFQAYMAQIGVNVTINQMDESAYYGLRSEGMLPSYRSVWWADFNDPDNFLYTFFSEKNSPLRASNYPNAEVWAQLDQARQMTDQDARLALYNQIEDTIVNVDAACIPLFQNNHVFCLSDRVSGFQIAWNGWSDMMYYPIELAK